MHKTRGITRLIHENLWIILSFAFAQPAITRFIEGNSRATGNTWTNRSTKYAEIRADRALLEMGTQLRVLDDEQALGDW
jgi:hypothetical protein